MRSSTLISLKNKYNSDQGNIELKKIYTSTDPTALPLHRLNVYTLFEGYKTFLKEKDSKEEEFFEFFGEITRKGAPAEVMVCAAATVDSEVKSESPYNKGEMTLKTCRNWSSNLNLALQYATIEYLYDHPADPSECAKIEWHSIITTLLALGADPNALSNRYETILQHTQSTLSAQNRRSAYAITMAVPVMQNNFLVLAKEFFNQSVKIKSPLTITAEQALLHFPKSQKDTSLMDHPVFQWLEKTFPREFAEYLQKNSIALIMELANNQDFKTIDHMRETYKVSPFSVLVEREEKSTPWTDTPAILYLYDKMQQNLIDYLKQNPERAMTRLRITELATAGQFDRIDAYRQRFGIDPFDTLVGIPYHEAWLRSPIFRYLNDRFSARLLQYIGENYEQVINRFALPALAAANQFAEIEECRTQFGIDTFPVLSEQLKQDNSIPWFGSALYSHLDQRFPDRLAAFILEHKDFLVQKFSANNDNVSIDRMKMDTQAVEVIMQKIYNDLCKKYTDGNHYMNEVFHNHPLFKHLEKTNPEGIWLYFKTNPERIKPFFKHDAGTDNTDYCAYRHDIDAYLFFSTLLTANNVTLNNYYAQRCRFILNFICDQTYPKSEKIKYASFKFKDKKVIVSKELLEIIKTLEMAMSSSTNASDLYRKILYELARKFLKLNADTQDENERAIYATLASKLNDNSALSRHVHREFLVHRDCVPLLMLFDPRKVKGVKHKPSVLDEKYNVTKDPLFDRKLLGHVFTFLGDYGLKIGESAGIHTETIECKNDNEQTTVVKYMPKG